ncbi:MAG: SPOR domain-containing protein [Deltaproteobacteria bacterium]|nr:SPOR domain-containing protein [Deltaproteobacteria bacterium]
MAIKNIRSFEFKLGKLGLILLITGMGVLVFGAFVLGVNVGKDIDTYPDKIVRGIPRLITEGIGLVFPKGKSDGDSKAQDKAALDLTFYDTLTKKGTTAKELIGQDNREETSIPAVIVAPAPPAVTTPPSPPAAPGTKSMPTAPGTQSAPTAPTSKVAPPKLAVAAPAATPPKAKAGGTEPTPPVAGPAAAANFSIQVISYDERVKANQLQKKLQGMGYKAEVSEMDISGKGKWYRVMVNNYQTRKEAEKAADNIKKNVKGLNCIVRQGDKS